MCYVLFVSSCTMHTSIKIHFVEFVVALQTPIKKKKKNKEQNRLLACWTKCVGNGFPCEASYIINKTKHIFRCFPFPAQKPKDVLILACLACLADVFVLKPVNTTYFL